MTRPDSKPSDAQSSFDRAEARATTAIALAAARRSADANGCRPKPVAASNGLNNDDRSGIERIRGQSPIA
jgi:hypothetical protein